MGSNGETGVRQLRKGGRGEECGAQDRGAESRASCSPLRVPVRSGCQVDGARPRSRRNAGGVPASCRGFCFLCNCGIYVQSLACRCGRVILEGLKCWEEELQASEVCAWLLPLPAAFSPLCAVRPVPGGAWAGGTPFPEAFGGVPPFPGAVGGVPLAESCRCSCGRAFPGVRPGSL